MRRIIWLGAAMLVFSQPGRCQPHNQQAAETSPPASSTGPANGSAQAAPTPVAHRDLLADAARRARAEKKEAAKATKVYTNDNLPSAVAMPSEAAETAQATTKGTSAPTEKPAAAMDEKAWRERFANLRHKLEQDQADLDVMQRELAVLSIQSYSDPTKALEQQHSRDDINKKTADIAARKKQVEADKQAIDDAETELRRTGGDPGWAR